MGVAKAALVATLVEMRVESNTVAHNLRSQCHRCSTRPLHLGRRRRRCHHCWHRCQMWAGILCTCFHISSTATTVIDGVQHLNHGSTLKAGLVASVRLLDGKANQLAPDPMLEAVMALAVGMVNEEVSAGVGTVVALRMQHGRQPNCTYSLCSFHRSIGTRRLAR